MREDHFVLHFDTVEGRYLDTAIAARALLDWVELVQAAVAVIDPSDELIIQIAGVTPGSTRFPQLLKWLEDHTASIQQAWSAYPHLKSVVAGSAHTFYTSAIAAGVTLAMQPSEQIVRLSPEDRALLIPLQAKVAEAGTVQTASKRFYRTVESDPAVSGVGVAQNWTDRPTIIVPRSEFSERGGLWEHQEDSPAARYQRALWDVVLLRPNLVSRPQPWQFSRDGLKFSAQMADANFLVALRQGEVPLNMQEGVVMRVEVEYQEVLSGQVWETNPRSRKIIRVLWPIARPQAATKKPR